MLTLKDLLQIEKIVEDKLDEKLDERLKFLPTKEEFFSRMDKLMGELKAMREAFDLHTGQHRDINDAVENHGTRIKILEKRVGVATP